MEWVGILAGVLLATGAAACETDFLPGYNRERRPNFGGPADNVTVGLRLYSFGPVDEKNMAVSVDLYLRLTWHDPRLLPTFEALRPDNSTERLYLGGEFYWRIWKPDFYFPDATDVVRASLEKEDSLQITLDETGGVFLSIRLFIRFRCQMPLHYFPMDSQRCPLKVSQYRFPRSEQRLAWREDLVFGIDQLTSPHFILSNDLHLTESSVWFADKGEEYPVLGIELEFRRKIRQFVVTMFLPSISLTVLSFLNFWIDKCSVPARASLSVTTILSQITLNTGLANTYPSGADIRLADIYLIVNFFFTFSVLVEFAVVSYKQHPPPNNTAAAVTPDTAADAVKWRGARGRRAAGFWRRHNADVISRFVYPPLFLAWNVGYFAFSFHYTGRFTHWG